MTVSASRASWCPSSIANEFLQSKRRKPVWLGLVPQPPLGGQHFVRPWHPFVARLVHLHSPPQQNHRLTVVPRTLVRKAWPNCGRTFSSGRHVRVEMKAQGKVDHRVRMLGSERAAENRSIHHLVVRRRIVFSIVGQLYNHLFHYLLHKVTAISNGKPFIKPFQHPLLAQRYRQIQLLL